MVNNLFLHYIEIPRNISWTMFIISTFPLPFLKSRLGQKVNLEKKHKKHPLLSIHFSCFSGCNDECMRTAFDSWVVKSNQFRTCQGLASGSWKLRTSKKTKYYDWLKPNLSKFQVPSEVRCVFCGIFEIFIVMHRYETCFYLILDIHIELQSVYKQFWWNSLKFPVFENS